jgi:hypothetical protein
MENICDGMDDNNERYNVKPINFTFIFHQKTGELRMQFDIIDIEEQLRLEDDIPVSSQVSSVGNSQQHIPEPDTLMSDVATIEEENHHLWLSLRKSC